jgi:DNA mismatch repair protein MSH2
LSLQGGAAELLVSRYAAPLSEHHDDSHLTKFELLLEASLDLEAVPQEYLISAAYDSRLQVMGRGEGRVAKLCGCC